MDFERAFVAAGGPSADEPSDGFGRNTDTLVDVLGFTCPVGPKRHPAFRKAGNVSPATTHCSDLPPF